MRVSWTRELKRALAAALDDEAGAVALPALRAPLERPPEPDEREPRLGAPDVLAPLRRALEADPWGDELPAPVRVRYRAAGTWDGDAPDESKAFSPDQARDEHGRWTSGGGGFSAKVDPEALKATKDLSTRWGPTEITAEDPDRRAVGNKLARALAGNRAWRATCKLLGGPSQACSGELLNRWASTTGDSDVVACSMQQAIEQEFGLTGTDDSVLNANPSDMQEYSDLVPGMRAYARAMYDQTQSVLKDNGITSVVAYRGFHWDAGDQPTALAFDGTAQTLDVTQQPASSWSLDPGVARTFATSELTVEDGGTAPNVAVVAAQIPAARILGMPTTGFGAIGVKEIAVLGGGADPVRAVSWNQVTGDAPSVAAVRAASAAGGKDGSNG